MEVAWVTVLLPGEYIVIPGFIFEGVLLLTLLDLLRFDVARGETGSEVCTPRTRVMCVLRPSAHAQVKNRLFPC